MPIDQKSTTIDPSQHQPPSQPQSVQAQAQLQSPPSSSDPNPAKPAAFIPTTDPPPLSTLAPLPTLVSYSHTFPQIIDADHFTITSLARRIRSPSTPASDLEPLILEATWRLVRHDLSEDIVMRPAFATHMGPTGANMADHDRQDHAAGRQVLVDLINSNPDFNDEATLARVLGIVGHLFDDLGQHMARESGEDIPRFCGVIDVDTSLRLAREYTATLCMTPTVVRVVDVDADGKRTEEPVFKSGVKEYVNADMATLTRLYGSVVESARYDGGRRFREQVEREVERLQVSKWLGYNERKVLKEGSRAGLGKL